MVHIHTCLGTHNKKNYSIHLWKKLVATLVRTPGFYSQMREGALLSISGRSQGGRWRLCVTGPGRGLGLCPHHSLLKPGSGYLLPLLDEVRFMCRVFLMCPVPTASCWWGEPCCVYVPPPPVPVLRRLPLCHTWLLESPYCSDMGRGKRSDKYINTNHIVLAESAPESAHSAPAS